jgi:hypothetical protein
LRSFIFFCSKATGRTEIWKVPSAGGKALQVTRNGGVVANDLIYYLRQNSDGSVDIRRFMLAKGEDSQIATVAKRVYLGLSMSPDGRYLVYREF